MSAKPDYVVNKLTRPTGGAATGGFVINLTSSTTPMALSQPKDPTLAQFTFSSAADSKTAANVSACTWATSKPCRPPKKCWPSCATFIRAPGPVKRPARNLRAQQCRRCRYRCRRLLPLRASPGTARRRARAAPKRAAGCRPHLQPAAARLPRRQPRRPRHPCRIRSHPRRRRPNQVRIPTSRSCSPTATRLQAHRSVRSCIRPCARPVVSREPAAKPAAAQTPLPSRRATRLRHLPKPAARPRLPRPRPPPFRNPAAARKAGGCSTRAAAKPARRLPRKTCRARTRARHCQPVARSKPPRRARCRAAAAARAVAQAPAAPAPQRRLRRNRPCRCRPSTAHVRDAVAEQRAPGHRGARRPLRYADHPPARAPFAVSRRFAGSVDVDEAIRVIKPEDTKSMQAIKNEVKRNAPVLFAVQLDWSVTRVRHGESAAARHLQCLHAVHHRSEPRRAHLVRPAPRLFQRRGLGEAGGVLRALRLQDRFRRARDHHRERARQRSQCCAQRHPQRREHQGSPGADAAVHSLLQCQRRLQAARGRHAGA